MNRSQILKTTLIKIGFFHLVKKRLKFWPNLFIKNHIKEHSNIGKIFGSRELHNLLHVCLNDVFARLAWNNLSRGNLNSGVYISTSQFSIAVHCYCAQMCNKIFLCFKMSVALYTLIIYAVHYNIDKETDKFARLYGNRNISMN